MDEALFTANNVWMLVATAMVFIMHLGFATLESGFVQKKNVVNILFKNAMIIAIGLLTYYIIGFNLMYPGINEGGFFGFAGFGLSIPEGAAGAIEYADGGYTYWTDFIFQGMFAATAATIVSGAVAERIKLESFLIFATIFVAICYPVTGMWKWGAGWLDTAGFYDFAGSTLVHALGGWGALAAVIILGARKGKYSKDGKVRPIPGHSMPLAAMGVFMLWFGWFGFNGGSVLSADPVAVSLVFVTTSLAAAAGAVAAFITSYLLFQSHDLSMVLNGILGGLVGITAGADLMGPGEAIIIGGIAGIIIPFSVVFFDKYLKLDDPVGATSVHLVCGIWGTLAVGLLGTKASFDQLWIQLYGTLAVGVFTFIFAFSLMYLLKLTIGIRVSDEYETAGLDVKEHDMNAYEETVSEPVGYQLSVK
ncbi:MAG: ammonium transporter [Chitinophagales bacterium]|nr:ammonium transporter [Chitinophagales bacterium]